MHGGDFKVSKPLPAGDVGETAVGTRRALTWKMVGGVRTVTARLVAKGFQDRDLKDGDVGTLGRVGFGSPSSLKE